MPSRFFATSGSGGHLPAPLPSSSCRLFLAVDAAGVPMLESVTNKHVSHPIFNVSGAGGEAPPSLRLSRAGADAMKAVAIVSGWIACTDETGERCAILKC
jgi:hypothetical protein